MNSINLNLFWGGGALYKRTDKKKTNKQKKKTWGFVKERKLSSMMPILMQSRFQSRQARWAACLRLYAVHNFLAPGTSFMKDNFSMDGSEGMVSGWFEHITFIAHFVSVVISAPPQILRHSIPEVGGPSPRQQEQEGLVLSRWALLHSCRTGC